MKALVLSGGARKGAYQAGAIRHLMGNLKTEYDLFAGISVGAINAAFLAQFADADVAADRLYDLWCDVNNSNVRRYWYGGALFILPALWKGSVYDSSLLGRFIQEKLDPQKIIENNKRLLVGAVSLDTGKYRVFDETFHKLHDAVQASSAFPGFLQDVEIEGELYTDGGIRNIVPLHDAVMAGATEIDVILTGPLYEMAHWVRTYNALFKSKRILDIMSTEILTTDFLNYCSASDATIRLLAPSTEFAGDPLNFNNRAALDAMLSDGYEDALEDRWVVL